MTIIPSAINIQSFTKLFSPYIDVTAFPQNYVFVDQVNTSTCNQFYCLSFIVAGSTGTPSWGTYYNYNDTFYGTNINNLRNAGGDIIISFGGASNTELANYYTDANVLTTQYNNVLTYYNCNYFDFDLENAALNDQGAVDRRNKAIASLQGSHPNLKISYTLPTTPTGLDTNGMYVLTNASANNVIVNTVNPLCFDFYSNTGANQFTVAALACSSVSTQLSANGFTNTKVTCTFLNGKADDGAKFTITNANSLLTYAKNNSWMDGVRFWSVDRDNSSSGTTQSLFQFTKLFRPLNSLQ